VIGLGILVFVATACADVLAAWWHRSVTSGRVPGAVASGLLLYSVTTAEALLVVRESPVLALPGAAGVAVGSALGAYRRARSVPE